MSKNAKNIVIAVVIVVVAALAYVVMTTPEQRTAGETIEDAVGELDNGVDNAARELEDRTPAEKVEDAVEDATDSNQ